MKTQDAIFQSIVLQLVETLREELRQNQKLLKTIRRKKESCLAGARHDLESFYGIERELVTNVVMVERDRIALVTELGQILGHPSPSRLRIAEILLYVGPESRDELLELREEFRDVADEIDDLVAAEPRFTRHKRDQVRLYITPSRSGAFLKPSPAAPQAHRQDAAPAVPGHEDF